MRIFKLIGLLIPLSGCLSVNNSDVIDISSLVDIGPELIDIELAAGNADGKVNVKMKNNTGVDINVDRKSIGYDTDLNQGILHIKCEKGSVKYSGAAIYFQPSEKSKITIGKNDKLEFSIDFYDNFKFTESTRDCQLKYRVIVNDISSGKSIYLKSDPLKLNTLTVL